MVPISHAFVTECAAEMTAPVSILFNNPLPKRTNPGTIHIIQYFTITYAHFKSSVKCYKKVF